MDVLELETVDNNERTLIIENNGDTIILKEQVGSDKYDIYER